MLILALKEKEVVLSVFAIMLERLAKYTFTFWVPFMMCDAKMTWPELSRISQLKLVIHFTVLGFLIFAR